MQRQEQPAVDLRRVEINKTLMAALRVVPGLPARAVLPELVPHGAHLHPDGALKAPLNLRDELGRPIPALVAAAQDRTAVNGIEIHAVEAAMIDHVGMVGGDFLEEGRFRVGDQQAEAIP